MAVECLYLNRFFHCKSDSPKLISRFICATIFQMKHRKKYPAPQISEAVFRGQKSLYSFEVYPLSVQFNEVPAVYVISKRKIDRQGRAHHFLVCVGQTESLVEDIKKHKRDNAVRQLKADTVSVILESDEAKRLEVENDLKSAHAIACQHNSANFNFVFKSPEKTVRQKTESETKKELSPLARKTTVVETLKSSPKNKTDVKVPSEKPEKSKQVLDRKKNIRNANSVDAVKIKQVSETLKVENKSKKSTNIIQKDAKIAKKQIVKNEAGLIAGKPGISKSKKVKETNPPSRPKKIKDLPTTQKQNAVVKKVELKTRKDGSSNAKATKKSTLKLQETEPSTSKKASLKSRKLKIEQKTEVAKLKKAVSKSETKIGKPPTRAKTARTSGRSSFKQTDRQVENKSKSPMTGNEDRNASKTKGVGKPKKATSKNASVKVAKTVKSSKLSVSGKAPQKGKPKVLEAIKSKQASEKAKVSPKFKSLTAQKTGRPKTKAKAESPKTKPPANVKVKANTKSKISIKTPVKGKTNRLKTASPRKRLAF